MSVCVCVCVRVEVKQKKKGMTGITLRDGKGLFLGHIQTFDCLSADAIKDQIHRKDQLIFWKQFFHQLSIEIHFFDDPRERLKGVV